MCDYTQYKVSQNARMRETPPTGYTPEQCEYVKTAYERFCIAQTQYGTSVIMFYSIVIAHHARDDIRSIPLWDAIGMALDDEPKPTN